MGWLQDWGSDFSIHQFKDLFHDPHYWAETHATKGFQSHIGPMALNAIPYVGPLLSEGSKLWLAHEARKGVANGKYGQTPVKNTGGGSTGSGIGSALGGIVGGYFGSSQAGGAAGGLLGGIIGNAVDPPPGQGSNGGAIGIQGGAPYMPMPTLPVTDPSTGQPVSHWTFLDAYAS